MSTDDFIKKMNQKVAQIEKVNKPLELAVKSIMSLQSKRIFLDGKNSEESIIGQYKGKDIYVNPTKPNKWSFATKGKKGESVFKNGRPHKTGYFGTYLGFKTAVGRNRRLKTVDLFLTGQLHRKWANSEVIGKAEAIKINQHNYITTLDDDNAKKIERYGKVFNLSIKEKGKFLSIIQFELAKALR